MADSGSNRTAGGQPPAARVRDGGARELRVPGAWVDWRERRDRPLYSARLWPHRSLDPRGHRVVLGLLGAGFTVPLIPAIGTPVFWGLLPFLAGALAMMWVGFRRSLFDGRLTEEVLVWPDEIRVERREPRGRVHRWAADPFHVRLTLHPEAKVEHYLTLRGSGREIELGAFLSPWERLDLAAEIEAALTRAIRG
jgi:uncharacterized membrane protein